MIDVDQSCVLLHQFGSLVSVVCYFMEVVDLCGSYTVLDVRHIVAKYAYYLASYLLHATRKCIHRHCAMSLPAAPSCASFCYVLCSMVHLL